MDEEDDYEYYDAEEPDYEPEPEPEPEPEERDIAEATEEEETWEPYEPPPQQAETEEEPDVKLPGQYAAADTGTLSDATAEEETFKPWKPPTAKAKAGEEETFTPYEGPDWSVAEGAGVFGRAVGQAAVGGVGAAAKSIATLPEQRVSAYDQIPPERLGEQAAPTSSPDVGADVSLQSRVGSAFRGERAAVERRQAAAREQAQQAVKEAGPVEQRPAYQTGQAIQEWGQKNIPLTQQERETYPTTTKAGEAIGGAAGALAAGAAGALVNPTVGMVLAGGVMAAQSAGDTFDRARQTIDARIADAQKKGDVETSTRLLSTRDVEAAKAAGLSAVVNGTMGALPVGVILRPVQNMAPGLVGRAWAVADHAWKSGITFAGVGEAQHYIGEQLAKQYDPNAHYDFDYQRVIASLIAGAVLGGGSAAIQRRPPAPVAGTEVYGPPEAHGPPEPYGPRFDPTYPAAVRTQEELPGIGSGGRQMELPLERPAPPPPATERGVPPVEPPVVNAEGQYGFNIEAPQGAGIPRTTYEGGRWITEPARANRPPMPEAGGVSRESAPPAGDRSTGDTRYGKETQAREEPGSGINVLQPGEADPTLQGGLQGRNWRTLNTEARTTTVEPSWRAEPEPPTRFGGQFKQEPPPRPQPEVPGEQPGGVRTSTPQIDEAVKRATAPEPAVPAAEPARVQNVGEQLKQKAAAERAARAEPAPIDPKLTNRLLNQPRILRQEAAKRGMTPEALKAQAQEILSRKKAAPVKEEPAAPVKATPADDLSIPDFLRRVAKDERGGGRLPLGRRGESDIRRAPVKRDRSGRPIKTKRLPIGTEQRILEKGAEKATGPKGEPRAPYREPAARQGPEEPPAKKPRVITHSGAVFTGDTVHAAAAFAKGAGFKPHQIFEPGGKLYEPPGAKTAAAKPAEAPVTEAAAKPTEAPVTEAPAKAPTAPAEEPQQLAPATKADLQQGLISSVRRMFGGMLTRGTESQQVARKALDIAHGPLARTKEQTASRFTNDLHRIANKMDQPAFEKFVDAYENGKVGTLPNEQQKLAKVLRENYADFWNEIKKLPGTEKMEAIQDYLTHMYKNDKGQASNFAREWYGSSGGSLKERTHPTYADAKAAGLEPLSHNPIEHFIRYSEGISHHLAQRQLIEDLKSQNRIGYFGPKIIGASGAPEPLVLRAPPDGYAELKMPWAADKFGRKAYAPRDIAETLNQFYDAGLRRSQTKDIYEFAQQTKNMWTAVELGLSAYHATTMGVESVASGMARSLQMAASGNYKGAITQLLKTPVEPITSALYGTTGRKIYRDTTGKVGTPIQRRIIDTFAKANVQPGNLRITGEYDMTKLGNFWDAYKRGSLPHEFQAQLKSIADSYGLKLPAVLLENVRRAVQTISKPLFEHYIPALKLGTMMKDMEAWLHANPNATDAQMLNYARKITESIDNRMGEMNYDKVHMNKTTKELAMLALRSFGFTVGGPMREIGVGAGRLALTAAQRKNPLKHFDLRSEHADPRAAYAIAFLPAIAAVSTAYQLLRTGKWPDDWRDLVTPKTGGMVKSIGKMVPERILVPGYHKDFLGYFVNPQGPLHELKAKLAAPWTALIEQLTGEDWRGEEYVPPRATTLEWLKAHGQQLGSHMLPIGPKQLFEGTKPGSKLTLPEQMIGVRTPGGYMLNPEGLEKYLTNKRQKQWSADEKRENQRRIQQGLSPLPRRQLPRASP